MNTIMSLRGITKSYFIGHPNEFQALKGVDLQIMDGEFVAVVGESGSGKSTLMNVIGALDRPTSGEYFLDGMNVGEEEDQGLSKIRNRKIGFVFQTFNLIPRSSAQKNVELPMTYAKIPPRARNERARQLLEMVGLLDRAKHPPN
jgi:putative ABC transport system ATP-binding protein